MAINMKPEASDNTDKANEAVCGAQVYRLPRRTSAPATEADQVVVERPVTIMIEGVGSFTLLCTPSDVEALAVGFVHSEGLIDGLDDIVSIAIGRSEPNIVGVRLSDPSRGRVERNMIMTSSCGLCGSRNIDKTLAGTPVCGTSLKLSEQRLQQVADQLQARQEVFRTTGAAHAAGLFRETGDLLAVAEDIGRHNALDKAIGKCLLAGRSTAGCGAVLSGRVTFEIVAKAARAGTELIAAVSGPSSLAVEAARRWHITLCGFVRPGRANVYTCPERIEELREC